MPLLYSSSQSSLSLLASPALRLHYTFGPRPKSGKVYPQTFHRPKLILNSSEIRRTESAFNSPAKSYRRKVLKRPIRSGCYDEIFALVPIRINGLNGHSSLNSLAPKCKSKSCSPRPENILMMQVNSTRTFSLPSVG